MTELTNNDEGLEIKTPGGWAAKATGPHLMLVIVTLLCTAMLALLMHQHQGSMDAAVKQRDKDTNVLLQYLIEAKESRNEQTYISSLNDAQRSKLNLTMPDSLRRKIRESHRVE